MKNIYRSLVAGITDAPERRFIPYDRINLRDDSEDDNIVHFEGYASTFQDYEMYGGPAMGGWIERMAPGAFDRTLREKPDLHFLINHEGLPIARTKSGTMQLSVDQHGLKVVAQLDKRDPDVQGLAVKMERGDMDEMSFAFRVKSQKWEATPEFKDDDQALRTITELSLHKGDVSVVNWGANPTTSAKLRSAEEALKYLSECDDDELAEARANGAAAKAVERLGGPKLSIQNFNASVMSPDDVRKLIAEAGEAAGKELGDAIERDADEAKEITVSIRREDGSLLEGHHITEFDERGGVEIIYTMYDIVSRAKSYAALETQFRESNPDEMRRIDVGMAEMERQLREAPGEMAQWPSDEAIDEILRAEDEANAKRGQMTLDTAFALMNLD